MIPDTKHKIFLRTKGVLVAPPIPLKIQNKKYVRELKDIGGTANYFWIQYN